MFRSSYLARFHAFITLSLFTVAMGCGNPNPVLDPSENNTGATALGDSATSDPPRFASYDFSQFAPIGISGNGESGYLLTGHVGAQALQLRAVMHDDTFDFVRLSYMTGDDADEDMATYFASLTVHDAQAVVTSLNSYTAQNPGDSEYTDLANQASAVLSTLATDQAVTMVSFVPFASGRFSDGTLFVTAWVGSDTSQPQVATLRYDGNLNSATYGNVYVRAWNDNSQSPAEELLISRSPAELALIQANVSHVTNDPDLANDVPENYAAMQTAVNQFLAGSAL